MKTQPIIALCLSLLLPGQVLAACNPDDKFPPPAEYDYMPRHKFRIVKLDFNQLKYQCDRVLAAVGFAPLRWGYMGCTDRVLPGLVIYILENGSYSMDGQGCVTEEDIIRHERAHLNGWNHS
jgi:hypothetical protein